MRALAAQLLGVSENLVGQLQRTEQRHRSNPQAEIRTRTGHRTGGTRVC